MEVFWELGFRVSVGFRLKPLNPKFAFETARAFRHTAFRGYSIDSIVHAGSGSASPSPTYMGIVLNYCQYGVLYLGSHYNTGPYINFPHFGNSNLGKLPYRVNITGFPENSNMYFTFLNSNPAKPGNFPKA